MYVSLFFYSLLGLFYCHKYDTMNPCDRPRHHGPIGELKTKHQPEDRLASSHDMTAHLMNAGDVPKQPGRCN